MKNLNDLLSKKVGSIIHSNQRNENTPEGEGEGEGEGESQEGVLGTDAISAYVEQVEQLLSAIKEQLAGQNPAGPIPKTHSPIFANTTAKPSNTCEGVFNGECMVGSDGKRYPVPPNYASKSKLVEGDMLKVSVTPNGTLIFKQIGPMERDRVIGELALEEDGTYRAICDGKPYKLLTAAVTFHKGRPGEQVVVLIPKDTPSKWAAVEYVIKK